MKRICAILALSAFALVMGDLSAKPPDKTPVELFVVKDVVISLPVNPIAINTFAYECNIQETVSTTISTTVNDIAAPEGIRIRPGWYRCDWRPNSVDNLVRISNGYLEQQNKPPLILNRLC